MKIRIIDGSNYFRGLMLLIRQDRKVTDSERALMKRIGKSLGFEREFCEKAIHEILDNFQIPDTAPEFSSKELALKFIKDGLTLAMSDVEVHPLEEEWLRRTALHNGIDEEVFNIECSMAKERAGHPVTLEVENLIISHS